MATSVLTQNHLLFKDSSQVDQVKLTSNAGFLHLASGASSAACEIKNLADATHANSAVSKQQLEAAVSASESSDAAARSALSSNLTSAYTADIATQAAASLAGRNSLQSNITSEQNARVAAINSEASSRASDITTEQNARASAITGEQNARAAAIANEVSARNTAIESAVSAHASGVHWKDSCRVLAKGALPACTANLAAHTLTANAAGVLSVDGVNLQLNDRLLVNGQSAKKENGLYVVSVEGSASVAFVLTRSSDANSASHYVGLATFIREGSNYQDQGWILTSDGVNPGVDDINFDVFSTTGEFSGSASVSVVNKVVSVVDQSINTNKLTDDAVTDDKCSFTHVEATQATFSGNVQAQQYTATSDERLKQNIVDLNECDCTAALMSMRCCEYEFKSVPSKARYGTVAQDCLLSSHDCLKNLVKTDENDMYSVNYLDLVTLLTASLKDAHQKIDILSAYMDNSSSD